LTAKKFPRRLLPPAAVDKGRGFRVYSNGRSPVEWCRLPGQTALAGSRRTWLNGARVERRLAAIPAADAAGSSRLMGEAGAGTLARLAGLAHAMCDASAELVADPGHICDASGVGVVIDVTALPLSPPASRIIAEDPDLGPRLAGVGDEYELVFTSPTDASPA